MKKTVLVVLYILFHLFVLREIRTAAFTWQTQSFVPEGVHQIEEVTVQKLGARLVYFEYESRFFNKVLTYKFPFGFFFLIGIIGLILIGSGKNLYLILVGIHIFTVIIASLIFSILVYHSIWWFTVVDMLTRYFIPLSSIGIIPLSLLAKRNLLHERKAS